MYICTVYVLMDLYFINVPFYICIEDHMLDKCLTLNMSSSENKDFIIIIFCLLPFCEYISIQLISSSAE